MEKSKLIFLPPDQCDEPNIDIKINCQEMVMIKTRIDGFEQTISVPFGSRLNKEKINE